MKKTTRIIALALVLIMSVTMLMSCGNKLSGKYSASESGAEVAFEFKGNKCTISISFLGVSASVDSTYKIEDDTIRFTFSDDEDSSLLADLVDEFSEPVPFKKGSGYIEIGDMKLEKE